MRPLLAGIFALITFTAHALAGSMARRAGRAATLAILLLATSPTLAQQPTQAARGEVEVIGFQNYYRPNGWVPMVVRIRPEGLPTGTYQIQVHQKDLDKDRAVYQRQIPLTGAQEGQTVKEQRFFAYFVPQPTDNGLPEPSDGLGALKKELKVYLADARGKPLAELPVTATITSAEPYFTPTGVRRADKFILAVSDPGASQVARVNYQDILGVKEGVAIIPVAPGDLPDNVIGYESVDAIVMLNVDPANLKLDDRISVLRQWVREGGNLVVCQNPQWEKMFGWGDLLPVTYPQFGTEAQPLQGSADRNDLFPLRRWARADTNAPDWERLRGPFKVGLAQAKPGAIVADEMEWPAAQTGAKPVITPYLVRQPYGLGATAWVAQDLGDPMFARVTTGWPYVWDKVFDWKNDTRILLPKIPQENERQNQLLISAYGLEHGWDLSTYLNSGMEHSGKGAALLMVAVAFFIGYWVIAGPVSYFVLAGRGKASQSWFVFGGIAITAALLTAGVVRLVLRGPPEVRHTTVVRSAAHDPAVAQSRIGLYVPRDNPATPIALAETAPGASAYITPYPIHPQHIRPNAYAAYMQYTIQVPDAQSNKPPAIEVPYRSTLKKLEAKWVGNASTIQGNARLLPPDKNQVAGQLTNGTGKELQNVYIAFNYPGEGLNGGDWVLWINNWLPGETLDLNREFANARQLNPDADPKVIPGSPNVRAVRGRIGNARGLYDWDRYWYGDFTNRGEEADYSDSPGVPRAFAMLSLYDRLPTPRNTPDRKQRFELRRRGARNVDLSPAIAAGAMAVVATAPLAPLPFPFLVEGDKVGGTGTVYYQAVIPIDRSTLQQPDEDADAAPTTHQSATRPATP